MHTKSKKSGKGLHSFLAIVLALLPLCVFSQPADNSRKVDTLSFKDRLSIRTNATDWLLMVPNVGVEFDLGRTNWNRWAINANFRYRPGSSSDKVGTFLYSLMEIKVEGRMYWRTRQAQATGPMQYHLMPWDKLFSCRRMMPKHPNTVFYRGIYATYDQFTFLIKDHGYFGKAAQLGFTWGFVKPLYTFANGNSLDMEIGISAGLAYARYHNFRPNEEANVYFDPAHPENSARDYGDIKYETTQKKILPMINDLHAAIVYRIGKYPVRKKYRWRYDVDMVYHDMIDSAWMMRDRNRIQKLYRDSVYNVVAKDFRETYDSVIAQRHAETQERINNSAPKRMKYIKVLATDPRAKQALKKNNNAATKKEN